LQARGAQGAEVFFTAHIVTLKIMWACVWGYGDGDVVIVHEAYIVEIVIVIVISESGNGGRHGTAKPVVVEFVAAVSGDTFAFALRR